MLRRKPPATLSPVGALGTGFCQAHSPLRVGSSLNDSIILMPFTHVLEEESKTQESPRHQWNLCKEQVHPMEGVSLSDSGSSVPCSPRCPSPHFLPI